MLGRRKLPIKHAGVHNLGVNGGSERRAFLKTKTMNDFEKKYYDLLEKVADMRKKQKAYFKCRSGVDLSLAKKAESKVDEIIMTEIGRAQQIQTKMF
jgi:hypothetical protein